MTGPMEWAPQQSLWPGYGGSSHMFTFQHKDINSSPFSLPKLECGPYPSDTEDRIYAYTQDRSASYEQEPSTSPFSLIGLHSNHQSVQDYEDDELRKQSNDLMAFTQSHKKFPIIGQQGHPQQIEVLAQLHGLFFLSETSADSADGLPEQYELTCYRRNLFQVSGSILLPRGKLAVAKDVEGRAPLAITKMEVCLTAFEVSEGKAVRLIVVPCKSKSNSSGSPCSGKVQDQDPSVLTLTSLQDGDCETGAQFVHCPIVWRRLQFKSATANNGRRRDLRQQFVLVLRVRATLADGSMAVVAESTTAPIVVRGRSPQNFKGHKHITLLGSRTGSISHILAENDLSATADTIGMTGSQELGHRSISLSAQTSPLSPAIFDLGQHGGCQDLMDNSSYPSWDLDVSTSNIDPFHSTPLASGGNIHSAFPTAPRYTAEPIDMLTPTSMTASDPSQPYYADQSQPSTCSGYSYHMSTSPKRRDFPVDIHGMDDSSFNNPRPSKMARRFSNQHKSLDMSPLSSLGACSGYTYGL